MTNKNLDEWKNSFLDKINNLASEEELKLNIESLSGFEINDNVKALDAFNTHDLNSEYYKAKVLLTKLPWEDARREFPMYCWPQLKEAINLLKTVDIGILFMLGIVKKIIGNEKCDYRNLRPFCSEFPEIFSTKHSQISIKDFMSHGQNMKYKMWEEACKNKI